MSARRRSDAGRYDSLIDRPDPDLQMRLVDAARGGDRGALDQLLRLHHDRIWQLCRRIVGNDADAADATQEALIAIVRGLARFDGRASFSTWAYRVATNACLDELRRRRRRPVASGDDLALEGAGAAGPPVDTLVTDRATIDAALTQLPDEFRLPVILRDLCDLDYHEIADVLSIPGGTVRSRISRGRSALASALRNQPGIGERRIQLPDEPL